MSPHSTHPLKHVSRSGYTASSNNTNNTAAVDNKMNLQQKKMKENYLKLPTPQGGCKSYLFFGGHRVTVVVQKLPGSSLWYRGKQTQTFVSSHSTKRTHFFVLHISGRFHSKGLEGVLENLIFGVYQLLAVVAAGKLRSGAHGNEGTRLHSYDVWILGFGVFVSFTSIAHGVLDIDYRVSNRIRARMDASLAFSAAHLWYRSSEVTVRLLTAVIMGVALSQTLPSTLVAVGWIAMSYLGTIVLMVAVNPADSLLCQVLIAMPLMAVNVTEFVDVPASALAAKQLSKILKPLRVVETVVCFVLRYGFGKGRSRTCRESSITKHSPEE